MLVSILFQCLQQNILTNLTLLKYALIAIKFDYFKIIISF